MPASFWTRKFCSFQSHPIVWLWLILLSLLIPSGIPAAAQTATDFAIGTTVQRTGVKRLGINITGENTYDSAQMMKNLLYQSPGFEGEIWRSILNCVVTSRTTCQDKDFFGAWPANFLKGASFQFIYGVANGQTGTIASNTASNYSGNAGVILTFSAPLSPAPAPGDYLIVNMHVPGNAQAGWRTSTSGGASISTDTTDIAPDSPGKQALSISAAGSGQSAGVSQGFDTTGGRSFVQLTGTYTFAFKAKGMGGNNRLNLSIQRLATAYGNETFLNQNVTLTNRWQDYSYTFNAHENGSFIGPVVTSFSVGGASIYLDDVSLTPAATAANPTAFRDEVVARLKSLRPGVLRYMNQSMLGNTIDNMLAVPFARQRSGFDESTTEMDSIAIGIPEFLALCQTVGAEPWINVPSMVSPTEMQNLIQYLATGASTTYGAIRAAQGQSAPWTSVFPVIHLELGNEMWNGGAFWGQTMLNSTAYGNRAATIFAAARATPGYNPGKFDLVLGSQAVNPGSTSDVMAHSSGYDSMAVAPYLFLTLKDYSSNEGIFGPMFAQPEQIDSTPNGYMAQQAQTAAAGSTPAKLDVYEVNLSSITGAAASQKILNQVAGGTGSGIVVADHMLLMIRDLGIMTQAVFCLPGWVSGFSAGGSVPLWGSVIDMGGETNLSRPTFLAEELANSAIMPTMLSVTASGSNPTWDETGTTPNDVANTIQLPNAHYLQSFAFTNGTQNSVVVMNLSRSGSLPITFSGANAPTGDVFIRQLTSTNITDNNENLTSDRPAVRLMHANVSNFNPAAPFSLPPFSMTVFFSRAPRSHPEQQRSRPAQPTALPEKTSR